MNAGAKQPAHVLRKLTPLAGTSLEAGRGGGISLLQPTVWESSTLARAGLDHRELLRNVANKIPVPGRYYRAVWPPIPNVGLLTGDGERNHQNIYFEKLEDLDPSEGIIRASYWRPSMRLKRTTPSHSSLKSTGEYFHLTETPKMAVQKLHG